MALDHFSPLPDDFGVIGTLAQGWLDDFENGQITYADIREFTDGVRAVGNEELAVEVEKRLP